MYYFTTAEILKIRLRKVEVMENWKGHLNQVRTKQISTTKQSDKGFVHTPDIRGKDGFGIHMIQSNTWLDYTFAAETMGFQSRIVEQEGRMVEQGLIEVLEPLRTSIER